MVHFWDNAERSPESPEAALLRTAGQGDFVDPGASMSRCPCCGFDPDAAAVQALIDVIGYRHLFYACDVAKAVSAGGKDGPLSFLRGRSIRAVGKWLASQRHLGIVHIEDDKKGALWWIERV